MSVQFLGVCVQVPELVGTPRLYGMFESLRSEDFGPVKTLQKLAALSIVKSALKDPIRRRELVRVVKTYTAIHFSPFIGSDLRELSEFIVNYIPLKTSTSPHQEPHIKMYMRKDKMLMMFFSNTRFVFNQFPDLHRFLARGYQLLKIICRRPIAFLDVRIDNELPDSEDVAMRMYQICLNFARELNGRRLVQDGEKWTINMFKLPQPQ